MIRTRDFPVFAYMAFAKAHAERGTYNLLGSGMPQRPPGTLPFDAAALPLNTHENYGLHALRNAVSKRYGVPEAEVFVAPGTSGANFLLAGALLGPGDEAVVESPTYEILCRLPAVFGARAVRWDRPRDRGFRPAPETLLPLLTERTRAVFLSNPHNPSGVLLPPGTLEALARMTAERGIVLVVDEVYLDGAPRAVTARTLGGTVVTTSSLTKVYGLGGLRVGWALAPADLVGRLDAFHDLADVVCSVPAQALAALAFGHLDRLRDEARARFAENLPRVEAWVASVPGMTWTPPDAALFAFPRLPEGVDGDELFTALLRDFDTVVVPGRFFDGLCDHVRIGFGAPPDALTPALENIRRAIEALRP